MPPTALLAAALAVAAAAAAPPRHDALGPVDALDAGRNGTAARLLSTRPRASKTSLALEVGQKSGTVFFTHIRRAGGSTLEETLLKPAMKKHKRADHNCKEGRMARYAVASPSAQRALGRELDGTSLVWRHCPYGLHALLPPLTGGKPAPFAYLTLVRAPAERLMSWFAYCDAYSGNKCHSGKEYAKAAKRDKVSPLTAFYSARDAKLAATPRPPHENVAADKGKDNHPDWIEWALDDNYATRMLCGGRAHEAPPPLGSDALACAAKNLYENYAFVGVTGRYDEAACVAARVLGFPPPAGGKTKGPTTHAHGKQVPADFAARHAGKYALDAKLFALAEALFEEHLDDHPKCRSRPKRTGGPSVAALLESCGVSAADLELEV